MYWLCMLHVGVVPDGTYEVCSRTTGQAAAGNMLVLINQVNETLIKYEI